MSNRNTEKVNTISSFKENSPKFKTNFQKKNSENSIKNLNLNFHEFSLENLGSIELAKLHSSANRPLHKISNFTESVKFCPCCYLPSETPLILERYKFCENTSDFAECGIGIYLYFYYFRYAMLTLIICFFMSACPLIIFNYHYTKGLNTLCDKYYLNNNNSIENFPLCEKYLDLLKDSKFYINNTDWILNFNSDNIKHYRNIFKNLTHDSTEKVDNVTINYHIINFWCIMLLFYVNILYIIIVKTKGEFVDITNTSPDDYSLLCTNLNNQLDKFESFKEKNNNKYNDKNKSEVENFSDYLIKEVFGKKEGKELNIECLNFCYKLSDFIKYENKLNRISMDIVRFHKNFLVDFNNEKCTRNLSLLKRKKTFVCFKKKINYNDLKIKQKKIKEKINNIIKEFESSLNKNNFTGTMFITFNTIKDKEKFYNEFPHNIFMKFIYFLKNLKFYICKCFLEKKDIDRFHRRKKMNVYLAPDPLDIIWENLETTFFQRTKKSIIIYGISLILILISFGIVLLLTNLQIESKEKNLSQNTLINYSLSFSITIVITLLNLLFEKILGFLTEFECQKTKTKFQLSYSVKLSLFTFLTSGIVPLFANYSKNGWGENDNLIQNIFIIFLTNALLTPLMWTLNFEYLIKKIRQYFIEKKKENNNKTQKELNEIYELPSMCIFYKYSYIIKTLLMAFFYLPIFPLGIPISLVGFFLGYYLERFNFTHLYKRPEMLNETICNFYMDYFVVVLFVYGLGDFLFMRNNFKNNNFGYVNLIISSVLMIFPKNYIFEYNFIGIKESEINKVKYRDIYFNFYNDFERQNPITKKKGLINYLKKLYESRKISENVYDFAIKNIDKLNVMEMYYNSSLHYNLLKKQQAIANQKNNNIGSKNYIKKHIKIVFDYDSDDDLKNNENNNNFDKKISNENKKSFNRKFSLISKKSSEKKINLINKQSTNDFDKQKENNNNIISELINEDDNLSNDSNDSKNNYIYDEQIMQMFELNFNNDNNNNNNNNEDDKTIDNNSNNNSNNNENNEENFERSKIKKLTRKEKLNNLPRNSSNIDLYKRNSIKMINFYNNPLMFNMGVNLFNKSMLKNQFNNNNNNNNNNNENIFDVSTNTYKIGEKNHNVPLKQTIFNASIRKNFKNENNLNDSNIVNISNINNDNIIINKSPKILQPKITIEFIEKKEIENDSTINIEI